MIWFKYQDSPDNWSHYLFITCKNGIKQKDKIFLWERKIHYHFDKLD